VFVDKQLISIISLKKNSGASKLAQVVEHLPRKCDALNSNPSNAKKKKKYSPKVEKP
jgi:hypothetical protein